MSTHHKKTIARFHHRFRNKRRESMTILGYHKITHQKLKRPKFPLWRRVIWVIWTYVHVSYEHLKANTWAKNHPHQQTSNLQNSLKGNRLEVIFFLTYIMRKIFCKTENKLIQICVWKFCHTVYNWTMKRLCACCYRGQSLSEIPERFEYSYNDEEITKWWEWSLPTQFWGLLNFRIQQYPQQFYEDDYLL